MRLRADQLEAHLKKGLAPVYVVSGDEPLQLGEAADAIRAAARAAGYTTREILEADGRFDWNRLGQQADELSLFAEKKIVDLRLPGGKPGREGSAALVAGDQPVSGDLGTERLQAGLPDLQPVRHCRAVPADRRRQGGEVRGSGW